MERLVAVMGSVSGRIWKDLFHLQVPWVEKVIRGVVVYAFLLIALRRFGRRELGQFTAFDLVVLLTLSNILQNAMIGSDNSLLGGLIADVEAAQEDPDHGQRVDQEHTSADEGHRCGDDQEWMGANRSANMALRCLPWLRVLARARKGHPVCRSSTLTGHHLER